MKTQYEIYQQLTDGTILSEGIYKANSATHAKRKFFKECKNINHEISPRMKKFFNVTRVKTV